MLASMSLAILFCFIGFVSLFLMYLLKGKTKESFEGRLINMSLGLIMGGSLCIIWIIFNYAIYWTQYLINLGM